MTPATATAALPPFGLTGWPAERLADPYPVYRRYRAAARVHRAEPDGTVPTFYVLGHDEVAKVLSAPVYGRSPRRATGAAAPATVPDGHSALRSMVENWLVFLDPPRHTELRSLLNREFTPGVVTDLRGRIQDIAVGLLTELTAEAARTGTVDLVERFSAPFPILVISELLGVDRTDWAWLREQAVGVQQASGSRAALRPDAHLVAETAARELDSYFLELAARRRAEPAADLVSLLVSAQTRGEPLTDAEIVATCVHLMTAGHETTTNVLSKSVLTLTARPAQLARLRAAPLVPAPAVDELVRFDPPVQAVTRWAYRDVVLGGHHVPRGSKLFAVLGAANRDPVRFPDPDTLDLERGGRNLAFGLGIHYCLGAGLARTEIEIGLGLLLRALAALGDSEVDEVHYPYDLVFHGPERLTLRLR
ncbi:cytochrome P450 [Streptomyces uncialis]|uniref:cytochrome P450 n=1 Tax=Streptomyces uncialis TaxID=1048205 RepID=UPI0033E962FB